MEDNYDKLDDFFKKQMSDHQPDDSWNVPNDSLFENAISQVNLNNGKSRLKGLLWILPLCLVIGMLAYQIQLTKNISQLKLKLSNVENELNTSQETASRLAQRIDLNKEYLNSLATKEEELEAELTLANSKIVILSEKIQHVVNDNKDLTIQTNFLKNELSENINLLNANSHTNQSSMIYTDSGASDKLSEQQRTTFTIPKIRIEQLSSQSNTSIINLPELINNTNQSSTTRSKWEFGLGYNMNSSWVEMTEVKATNQESLKNYDKAHGCYGANLMLNYNVNKRLSIDADLAYNRFVNKSNINRNFFFDMENVEDDLNGDPFYNVNVAMQNPFGDYDTQTSFRVSEDMQQNCVIKETTDVRQKIDALTLNIGASYKFVTNNNFDLYFGGGLGINTILRLKNEFEVSYYLDETLRHSYQDMTMELEGVNKLYSSAYLKAGFTYKVNDAFGINVESRYTKGITTLRDSWPASGPNTYLNNLSLMVGMKYRLP